MVPVDIAATYSQTTGEIEGADGSLIALGWAGSGVGKNAPTMQGVRTVGPLPQGLYVVGVWCDHPRLGKMVAPLTQIEGETFNRSDFWIHGPSRKAGRYGQESLGCIIVPFAGRVKVKDVLTEGSYLRVTA